MPSVCFYFQVHQPFRIRPFSYFDTSLENSYFDEDKNREILNKVANKCYLPTNELMLRLIDRFDGRFRISYSITGVALEQFERYSPETLESFKRLVATGCVELLGETYYHSLAAVFQAEEFKHQAHLHQQLMEHHFNVTPTVFRNTELIYSDEIGRLISSLGYRGILAEGADDILAWRSPNFIYSLPDTDTRLLLKNYQLSDDVAFRFSNQAWEEFPLTADRYAHWVHSVSGNGEVVNLFMDYETFGEHQWESTGIFNFLEYLPDQVLAHSDWSFCTPSEAIDQYQPVGELSYHRLTSWADIDRDLTAWHGNRMQDSAIRDIYELNSLVELLGDQEIKKTWRTLQTSDHFYYMCTKWCADGDVHAYFSPFETPYDAFINYMNILRDFREQITERLESESHEEEEIEISEHTPWQAPKRPRLRA